MEAESFFARWEKRNADKRAAEAEAEQARRPEPAPEEPPPPPPTLDDVAALTPDSDFTRFVARGVDENVRRSAMKKLFADPQFNVMDGLDVYIEDYNKFVPLPAHLLGQLEHAKALLDPLKHLGRPVMELIDTLAAAGETGPEGGKTQTPAAQEGEDGQQEMQEPQGTPDNGAPAEQEPPQADQADQANDKGAAATPPRMEGQQDNDHPI